MNLELIKKVADTITHYGDYGILYVNQKESSVCWVAGDCDFEDDFCTSYRGVLEKFALCDTVKKVYIEDESGPDGPDWENLGTFGIVLY